MNPKVNETITVTITSIGKNGEGIANYQGCIYYVHGALLDEIVKVKIKKSSQQYCLAEIIEILEPSPHRTTPICALFGKCGGCQLMHMQYAAQLELKQKKVKDSLKRAGISANVASCLPSPQTLGYRNKIQLPVELTEQGIKIGLYARSSHDLVEFETCPVHCSLGESIFQKIKNILKIGIVKHVLIKTSINMQEVLITLVSSERDPVFFEKIAEKIMLASPYVKGVVLNVNEEKTNVILGKEYILLKGQSFISEKLHHLIFHISPASFFQVNTLQAEHLYSEALKISNLTGEEIVLDAYCGVGTLSLFFAQHAKKVIGVESVPEAIEDAKKNAFLNGVNNADFHCALAEKFIQPLTHFDLLILNPPRKGCAKNLLDVVKRVQPKKIIYISCDPDSLSRDLAHLLTSYNIIILQPFDMFPQTMHVETIVKLELK